MQDMWVFTPEDGSWVETQAFLNVPFAREGHASTMIKPEASSKKKQRRRRLLMDPGSDQITPQFSIKTVDPVIDGPNPSSELGSKPEVKEDTGSQQFMFVFGGSGEPGLIGEMQDASPM